MDAVLAYFGDYEDKPSRKCSMVHTIRAAVCPHVAALPVIMTYDYEFAERGNPFLAGAYNPQYPRHGLSYSSVE